MEIGVFQALLISFYYWAAQIGTPYGGWFHKAMIAGMVVGLILGDVSKGCIIGATIQPMFLAFTGAGGTIIWDECAGTIMGTAITMVGGLPLQQALTVAVPVSLLFAQVSTICRIWFAFPATQADKAAMEGRDRAIIWYGGWFCALSRIVLFFIPMFLSLKLGVGAIGTLMSNLPEWIANALNCVGGMLPALGFAMTVRVIARPTFLPYFLGGFFLVQYTKIGGLFLAFVGLFLAFLYYQQMDSSSKDDDNQIDQNAAGAAALDEDTKRLLTKKDCVRMFNRWWWFSEQSNSFSRLQSIAFCCSFIPALKKLYGNDPEEYKAALQRHLMFFNTEGIWGSVIHGIALAMEEQRAMGVAIDASAITGIKAGLMGPFAGIGDTIDWSTMRPLVYMLFIPMAAAGSPFGAILAWFVVGAIAYVEGRFFSYTGYKLGTRAALTMLQGRGIKMFISCGAVLGLFMMGGLSATMVSVTTPIYIPTSGSPAQIQNILNSVAPGLLTLATVLGTYVFIQRGNSMTKATMVLLCIGLVLGSIGVLGAGGLVFHAYVAPKV